MSVGATRKAPAMVDVAASKAGVLRTSTINGAPARPRREANCDAETAGESCNDAVSMDEPDSRQTQNLGDLDTAYGRESVHSRSVKNTPTHRRLQYEPPDI